MPTENQSSNTEMAAQLSPCPHCGQQDAFVEQLDSDASVVICQGRIDEYSACLARGPVGVQQHECEDQPGHDQAVKEWNKRAVARNHPDPIAWMVGTAFWWTKEEAERDAAETGLPIVGLGPMAGVAAAEQRSGEPVAWMAMTLKGSLAGTLGLARYDQRLNPDLYEGPFPVFRHADPGEVERLRGWVSAYKESRERLHEWLREEQLKNISLRAQLAEAQALLRKIGGYNWANVDPEERARTRAELRDMLSASAEPSALPEPLGCNECTHAECGRFDGPRQVECRAMADNACARPGASS
ncbi:restriction alleviation Lar family protein [Pseudomonas putida S610]|uniref:Lar family restriction alleviation protein n=1 Tax=Pseudomonas putida TaxID=303 RepID=UPI0003C5CE80|nr:Lar family restriction alleviation protein [Pseudomonas putida]EST14218.1 restriction alleviation Lar family protein [Pseudomonas putida S610]